MKSMFSALFFIVFLNAHAAEYRCPAHVDSDQTAKSAAEGWTTWPEKLNRQQIVEMVDVFSGHPNGGADLIPDNENDRQGNYRWSLKGEKNGVWMACVYSQTYIRYIKELPKGLKSCQLLFEAAKTSSRRQVAGLSCR